MSPEQARGGAGDFRSDQFALGLMLYEMATGQSPFRRETPAATLNAILHDEPVPLTTRAPRLPFVLSWIVERCLAKNALDRYGVTSDLHRDLRTLRDRLGETTPSTGGEGVARSGVLPWALAVGLLAIAAAAGALVAWRANAALPPIDLTDLKFRAIATSAAYEGLPAFSPNGETVAYVQDVDGVLQIFTRQVSRDTAARVTTSAFDCKYPFWSPDGKRLYYISQAGYRTGLWSIGVAGGSPEVVVENVTRAAISPDGRTLAFLRDEQRAETIGTAALWLSTPKGNAPWSNAAVQEAAQRYAPLGGARFIDAALAFSPDGTRLALCGVPGIREERMWQFWLIPLQSGEPQRRLQAWADAGPRNISVAWFSDGRHVALGVSSLSTPGSHVWVADLQTDRVWPLTRGADSESYPSAAVTGDRIVFTRGEPDFDLVSIPLAHDAVPQSLLATPQSESEPAFRPDGSVFAYVTDRTGQDEIWRRSLNGSVDEPLVTQRDFGDDRSVMLSSPVFSPDGSKIAYQRNGVMPRWPLRIWISNLDGGAAAPLLPADYEGIQGAPTWSQDGQFIAFAQWREQAWELAVVRYGSGEGPRILRKDGVANAVPHWSPRGTPEWITWETAEALVLVSPDGTREQRITTGQWFVHTWSADGTSIIGIKETENLKLALVSVTVSTGKERTIVCFQ
jgi:Tol biopolymer transport system component